MSEQRETAEQTPQSNEHVASPAADQAHQLGEQVGRFAVTAFRQLAALTAAALSRASVVTAPGGPASPRSSAEGDTLAPPSSAAARAEEVVNSAGARLGTLAADAGDHIRRAAAFAREEAEDVWVEAQQLRRQRRRPDSDPTP